VPCVHITEAVVATLQYIKYIYPCLLFGQNIRTLPTSLPALYAEATDNEWIEPHVIIASLIWQNKKGKVVESERAILFSCYLCPPK
jgi:hypothetical protein